MDAARPISKGFGFTLIELLVVLVILSIILSIAVLTTTRSLPAELRAADSTLKKLMRLAQEEAILRSAVLGVQFTAQGYTFVEHVNGQWKPIQNDALLTSYRLAADIRIVTDCVPPRLAFLPNGEIQPVCTVKLDYIL